jgi:hypothetical protein
MGSDTIEGIVRDVIVTLGGEVIEDCAHQRIKTRPTLSVRNPRQSIVSTSRVVIVSVM